MKVPHILNKTSFRKLARRMLTTGLKRVECEINFKTYYKATTRSAALGVRTDIQISGTE